MTDLGQFVSRPWYAMWDANGNETGDVRWLHAGRGRWYVEGGKWGINAQFGPLTFSLHFNPDERDDA